jgi:hypothetical protein
MAGIIQNPNKLGGVPQTASRYVAMSTCFDIFYAGSGETDTTLNHLGFISQITPGHSRTVTQLRHINSVDAGIAVDTTVTPDVITLNFSGFYVFGNTTTNIGQMEPGTKGAASDVLVGPSAGRMAGLNLLLTLDQQHIPFDIVIRHIIPSAGFVTNAEAGTVTNSTNQRIIGCYKNCTIATMSIPIVLGTAAISDSGSISVGYLAKNV